jgi:hypothetical protein
MLELSDYDENEEAHKSSNVECVEVNNGIKMANKRSKSLEKEEVDDVKRTETSDLLKRPDTAPPLLPATKPATKEVNLCEIRREHQKNYFCESNKTSEEVMMIRNEAKSITIFDSSESNGQVGATWHEHRYRKPPKMPTPFSIIDILYGNGGDDGEKKHNSSTHFGDHRISDSNNNSSRAYQNNHHEPSTLQQLLNLNIKTPSPRHFDNNNSQNGINSRGMSMSETSEDESIASDQPLNLCVTKSRDSSPGADRLSGKTKKGAIETKNH